MPPPGSGPVDPDIVFIVDGTRYTVSPMLFNAEQPLILLPDGRLLRAGGFDDGVPFNLTVVPLARAALA